MKTFAIITAALFALAVVATAYPAPKNVPAPKSSQINLPTITIVERAASGQTRTFEVALDLNRAKAGVCLGVVGQPPITTHCTFYVLGDTLFQGNFQ